MPEQKGPLHLTLLPDPEPQEQPTPEQIQKEWMEAVKERQKAFEKQAEELAQSLVDDPSARNFERVKGVIGPFTVDEDPSIQSSAVKFLKSVAKFEEQTERDTSQMRAAAMGIIARLEEEKEARMRGGVSLSYIACRVVESIYFKHKNLAERMEREKVPQAEVLETLESIHNNIKSLQKSEDADLRVTGNNFFKQYQNDDNEQFREAWLEFLVTSPEERKQIIDDYREAKRKAARTPQDSIEEAMAWVGLAGMATVYLAIPLTVGVSVYVPYKITTTIAKKGLKAVVKEIRRRRGQN